MQYTTSVFKFNKVMDDPRYDGFVSKGDFPDGLPPGERGHGWQKVRLATKWDPPSVSGTVRRHNDYPCVDLVYPVFSRRAVHVLRDLLEPNGEILPLPTPQGEFYAYNVCTIANALDSEGTEATWLFGERDIAIRVRRYEFRSELVENLNIFTIPQQPARLFVTNNFVARVYAHGLGGMDFSKLWPLSHGTSWERLARAARQKQKRKGLPFGQSVTGHSVVIRLGLSASPSVGEEDRKSINEMMDQLVALLVRLEDETTDGRFPGGLEGSDYGVAGECRLFFSCPDATHLASLLCPWFVGFGWPHSIVLIKRSGSYDDQLAKEETITVK